MQDIEPPQRSIRNVPVPRKRKARTQTSEDSGAKAAAGARRSSSNATTEPESAPPRRTPPRTNTKETGRHRRWWIWGIALVAVAGAVFAVSSLFTSATVTITPKKEKHTVATTLIAGRSGTDVANADLGFEVVELSATHGIAVEATSTREHSQKASGVVTVYNNHSSNAMTFVPETRFKSSDGHIYKTQKAVTIPGRSDETTPGTIEVRVVAAEGGAEYNRDSGELTVPGLEGDPSFDSVHAEVTEPISGGTTGNQKFVPEDVREQTYDRIQQELKTQLLSKMSGEMPDGFTTLTGLSTIEYQSEPQRDAGANQAELRQTGTLRAPIFRTQNLAQALLGTSTPDAVITIDNASNAHATVTKPFQPHTVDSFEMGVEGPVEFVWEPDTQKLQKALTGIDKDRVQSILDSFPSVAQAEIVVQPFWKTSLPEKQESITIKNTYTSSRDTE